MVGKYNIMEFLKMAQIDQDCKQVVAWALLWS